jgi:hypothetical protein
MDHCVPDRENYTHARVFHLLCRRENVSVSHWTNVAPFSLFLLVIVHQFILGRAVPQRSSTISNVRPASLQPTSILDTRIL